ncbi:LicD family protein [Lactococcus protaetiae]|uniref:LicD family protein n=1 Tax=Lactococcus protaetiae TaxID=2592653 RepID=A0A514Z7B7_9LACT|nr:LicD family protein [Lactococcus protaetiae]QDK70481.1 LicD family protein [Lactococcus protaetiae]
MRKLTNEEIWQCELEMLKYIDEICQSNQIEYSLAGGTLLGAIRHKGFIPWDDDVDLILTRHNYEKLMKVLMEENEPRFSLLYYKKVPTFISFTRLIHGKTTSVSKHNESNILKGVWVDIFPIDTLPDDKGERKLQQDKVKNIGKRLRASIKGGFKYASFPTLSGFLAKIIIFLPWHIRYYGKSRELCEKIDYVMQEYNDQDAKEKGFIDSIYFEKEHFPKEIFEKYEDVEFENLVVRKISNHDIYLKQLYGEYMKLPEEKDRVSHEIYEWYWK